MLFQPKFSQFNEQSILIEWPTRIDELILDDLLNAKRILQNHYSEKNIEIISAYSALLLIHHFKIENIKQEISVLKQLLSKNVSSQERKILTWKIPVCYDYGNDMEVFLKETKLKRSQVIQYHSQVTYTVFFIGFLPGFLYLGGLDKRLHLERKPSPKQLVTKGSVAIGGRQTGVYPQDSPGGWHCIGHSPIEWFSPNQLPPCPINPGDKIIFKPISKQEHQRITQATANSEYRLKPITKHA